MISLLLLALACNGGSTDADGDGVPDAEDCDDSDPSIGRLTWYPDEDGDGFGDEAAGVVSCASPAGHVDVLGDCDDADAAVYPGADELCDDLDQDCDGAVDEAAIDPLTFFRDADRDGVGDAADSAEACTAPDGYVAESGDCDDSVSAVYPGATPICGDGLDNDCDGLGDCGLALEGDSEMGEEWVRIDGTFAQPVHSEIVSGDFTGDGIADVVVGMKDSEELGIARLFAGPLEGPYDAEDASALLHGPSSDAFTSTPLSVGDIDGDGDADIAIGRRSVTNATQGWVTGAVFMALSPVTGDVDLPRSPEAFTIFGTSDGEHFGADVVLGDLSGDGVADLLVGAPYHGGLSESGRIYYVEGPIDPSDADVEDLTPSRLKADGLDDARLGEFMALVPDINGDGRDDLALGLPNLGAGFVALVYGGLPADIHIDDAHDIAIVNDQEGDRGFGAAFSGAGDLNGDGYGELLVGSPERTESGDAGAGRVWVLDGDALLLDAHDGLPPTSLDLFSIVGGDRNWALGTSVHGPGDLDGDGLGEVLVGAPGYEVDGDELGAAMLFTAPYSGTLDIGDARWIFSGADDTDGIGQALSSTRDMDGHGLPELAIFGENTSNTRSTSTEYGSLFLFPTDAL